jgi:hypothetical protein
MDKKQKTKIETALENVRLHLIGLEDIVKSGDDGWKESFLSMLEETRNTLLSARQVLEPQQKEKKTEIKEESMGAKLYAFFCRKMRSLGMAEIR